MIKFALITNFNITEKANAALAVAEKLLQFGECKILFSNYSQDKITRLNRSRASYVYLPNDQLYKQADIIIVLGGDGTILQAAQLLHGRGVPLLGVNLGHKGFLTELERDELWRLREAARGEYSLQRRMMLDAELLRQGRVIASGSALNDVAVNGIVNMVRLAAYGDGERIMEFSADGLIVATPTGATAYSLAAGGPLMEPDAESILLTPVCAHTLSARCFVLSPGRLVTIRPLEMDGRRAVFSVDGSGPVELQEGDEIRVRRSNFVTWMALLKGKSFYETAFDKLSDRS